MDSDGTTGPAEFTYSLDAECCPSGSWTFSTTADFSGSVLLPYHYSGFHAFFEVTVNLSAFVTHDGSTTTFPLVNDGPADCCTPPSGGFSYAGTTTLDVLAGDTYGFTFGGSNQDSNGHLGGTLTIGPTLTTAATASVPIGGTIADTATLANTAPGARGAITFDAYTDSECGTTPVHTLVVPVAGDGTYSDSGFAPGAVGTYHWTATYSGDPATNTLGAVDPCGAPGESSTVTPDDDLALTGMPADRTVDATGPSGAEVTYTPPTASDEEGGAAVDCSPASGSTFPIGSTTVTCTATDSDDSNSPVRGSFTVTVRDNDLALTGMPQDISVDATGPTGAIVSYTPPTAVDEDGTASASCAPASGSTFPIGSATVTCTATDSDDSNSPASGSFTVSVNPTSSAPAPKGAVLPNLADLSVTQSVSAPVVQGADATITLVVANAGLATATGVTVSESLPAQLMLNDATASSGSCSGASCSLGSLEPGATATVTLTVTPVATGLFTATATVARNEADANPANDTAALTVGVRLPPTTSPPPTVPPPPPNLPPPVQGVLVNAQPVTGVVLVDGTPFSAPGQIPVGAILNTTGGSIELVTQNQTGVFYGGVFKLVQGHSTTGFTTLFLQPTVTTTVCGKAPARKTAAGARRPAAVARPKVLALLWGSGKGRFRTQGRYSSATIRGTRWLSAERCDGTFTYVEQGQVAVYDIHRRRTIILTAGHSYLARPG